ncbi:MAG: OadG family protein [Paraprevotella sp.]|nr:OadG family protein [Paraprevotella sp.]
MDNKEINGEVLAAITMALHEYCGYTAHDGESGCLTVGRDHSDWNSKLCTLRGLPNRKF